MSVKKRLYIGFILIGFLTILNGFITKTFVTQIEVQNKEVIQSSFPKVKMIASAKLNMERSISSLKEYFLQTKLSPHIIEQINTKLDDTIKDLNQLKNYYDIEVDKQTIKEIENAIKYSKEFRVINEESINIHTQKIKLTNQLTDNTLNERKRKRVERTIKYIDQSEMINYDQSIKASNKVTTILEKLDKDINNNISQKESAIVELVDTIALYSSTIIISSIIGTIIISIIILKSIQKILRQNIDKLMQGSEYILSASSQVSSSANILSDASSGQASNIQEVRAVTEELTNSIGQNSNNAKDADTLSKDANDTAQNGFNYILKLSSSMEDITSSSAKIANIIKTIDEIAFQTNLLALNAAVEAARAGEHGLGFAVVAEEVRSLASRSAESAQETSGIIEQAIAEVNNGTSTANDTNEAFDEILQKIKKTGILIEDIATTSQEQSDGMIQINKAIKDVDSVTQSTASSSEELAAAAEQLNKQASSMERTIEEIIDMFGFDISKVSKR
jgi:methyl-accepting chemotaxis protein/methyl-accepting chemotaxis protein-2 (aspartate sensor receptor)